MEAVPRNIQMVRPNRDFCETEVRNFIGGLPADKSITVVSIFGPQSTGKSYLLNQLFGTDFPVLDRDYGQTTEGIWIAQCSNNPSMVVMDIEGSDSSNRPEDGTSFENQAALLALTISNALLLNIDVRDLGKTQGVCSPQLKTIFKERIPLLPGKLRVLVILRDCKNLTNMDDDIKKAKSIIQECWKSGAKTNGRLEDYMEVSVVQFPDATNESQSEAFQRKVTELQKELTPAKLIRHRQGTLHTAMFVTYVQQIWDNIKTNRKLDIPSSDVLQSKHRCEQIIEELTSLDSDKNFSELKNMQGSTSPELFKTKLDEFLRSTLVRFNVSADGCIEQVKDEFQAKLKKEILEKLKDTFSKILMTKKDEIFNETKVEISTHLRKCHERDRNIFSRIFTPITSKQLEALIDRIIKYSIDLIFHFRINRIIGDSINFDNIVNTLVKIFDDLFEDCCEEYKGLVRIYSDKLKKDLKNYAEQEEKKIKKKQKKHVIIKLISVIALGAAGCVAFFFIMKAFGVLLIPIIAPMFKANPTMIVLYFSSFVLTVIIPAAMNYVKDRKEYKGQTFNQKWKLLFDISVGALTIIVEILKQHSGNKCS